MNDKYREALTQILGLNVILAAKAVARRALLGEAPQWDISGTGLLRVIRGVLEGVPGWEGARLTGEGYLLVRIAGRSFRIVVEENVETTD